MNIFVTSKEPVMIIEKSKKAWEMNGRSGISYKAICMKKVDDETQVEEIRCTEETYGRIQPFTSYILLGDLDVKNGRFMISGIIPESNANKPIFFTPMKLIYISVFPRPPLTSFLGRGIGNNI